MKVSTFSCFIFVVVLIAISNGEVEICLKFDGAKNSVDTKEISTLLGEVSKELKNEIKKSKLDSDSSSNYTDFHLNISHPAITIQGNFTNGSVVIDDQDISLFNVISDGFEIFNLTFPSIYINGSYDMAGYVGAHRLFDVYGKGEFYLNLFNFSVAAVTSLKVNSTSFCIPITVKLYVKDYKNNFGDLMNGDPELEPLLNGAFGVIVPEAIMIFFREDADVADPYIQAIIDKILNMDGIEALSRLLYLLSNNTDKLFSKSPINLLNDYDL